MNPAINNFTKELPSIKLTNIASNDDDDKNRSFRQSGNTLP